MAVARLELIFATPILPRIAVSAAKSADKKANNNQDISKYYTF